MTTGVRRPEPIRFTDLGRPGLPGGGEADPRRLAGYGATLELTPQAMLSAAAERTGLDDFGDPAFRERLDVLCTSLREEAGLSDAGVAVAFEQLVGNLVNRLRLGALIARHPEIEDVAIERPIIICGLPHRHHHLHNLMAADPNLRHLPYWESLEPFPAPGDGDDETPRQDRCAAGVDLINTVMPGSSACTT